MKGLSRLGLLTVVLAVAGVVGFLLLAPSSLGGSTTWVSTTGDSMQPVIQAGDLVIARPQPGYQVGDVVAYPSQTLDGTVVLHRIVADKPQGFLTRGDHNDWLDPDHPQTAEILGRMWLHIPGGGRVLTVLASPFVIAALVLTLLTAGGLVTARRSRRGRGTRRATRTEARPPTRRPAAAHGPALQWVAGTALAAVALAVFAFGQPSTVTTADEVAVTHAAQLSYSAPVHKAGIYADNRVRTGDPVFLSVAPAIDTHVGYRLDTPAQDVTGTVRTTAVVAASNGWRRTVPLGRAQRFRGRHTAQTTRVDLPELLQTVQRAERQAGTTFGGYSLTIAHRIDIEGRVAGQSLDTTYRPTLTFALDGVQAIPQNTGDNTGVITLTQAGTTTVPITTPATLTVLRWDLPISLLRLLAVALAAASLLLAAATLRRRKTHPESAQIFGHRLVQASNIDLGDRPVIDVDDPEALRRLANLYDTVVTQLFRSDQQAFFVTADGTIYRYAEPVTHPEDHTGQGPHPTRMASHL